MLNPSYQKIDIQQFVHHLLEEFSDEKKQYIRANIDEKLVELESDYVILKYIVKELLNNALEHTEELVDSIELNISAQKIIEVTNYGQKIPQELEKNLLPFLHYQGETPWAGSSQM